MKNIDGDLVLLEFRSKLKQIVVGGNNTMVFKLQSELKKMEEFVLNRQRVINETSIGVGINREGGVLVSIGVGRNIRRIGIEILIGDRIN